MGLRKRKKEADSTTVHYVKGSRMPLALVVAIIVVSIILGVKLGSDWQQTKANKENHRKAITSDALRQEIEQIGELASVNYYYTNMGKFEDAVQLLEHDIPFTTKSFILSYDGEIKAGIDLSQVTVEIVDTNINLTIPTATITSHEVDMDSVILYDEKNSIFNGLSAEDVTGFIGEQQKLMEEKAIKNGLIECAQSSATQMLTTLLEGFVDSYGTEELTYDLQIVTVE